MHIAENKETLKYWRVQCLWHRVVFVCSILTTLLVALTSVECSDYSAR